MSRIHRIFTVDYLDKQLQTYYKILCVRNQTGISLVDEKLRLTNIPKQSAFQQGAPYANGGGCIYAFWNSSENRYYRIDDIDTILALLMEVNEAEGVDKTVTINTQLTAMFNENNTLKYSPLVTSNSTIRSETLLVFTVS